MAAPDARAEEFLHRFASFWRVRGRFYALAFGLSDEKDSRAATRLGIGDLISLKQADARGLWIRALSEVGGDLTREAAAELSMMGAPARLDRLAAAGEAFGLTRAGQERFFADLLAIERESMSCPVAIEFWAWTKEHNISGDHAAV